MGVSELELRRDTSLGLEAAGRVLAEIGAATGASSTDLASWERALQELSGFADDAHRNKYAHEVFALLARGGTFLGRDGEPIAIAPHDLPPSLTLSLDTTLHTESGAEYPGAEWFPTSCTNKCDATRAGNPIEYVVIHDTEGGWSASVATLQNDPGKSVQYIVNTDGHVGQFVTEATTAWHAGNYWYNQRSVGIEHVGYYQQPYPTAQYVSSAKLVDYLTKKYPVAKDRAHVIGHDQVPNGKVMAQSSPACPDAPAKCESGSSYGGSNNHRDPGDWEWCTYMPRFGGTCKCDDVTARLTCSADKTEAVRCVNGSPQLLVCDGAGGCATSSGGQDDVCHQAPVPDAGGPSQDASVAPPRSDGGSGGGSLDASTTSPSAAAQQDAGCSQAPGSAGSIASMALVGLALIASRRRPRARR